MAELLGPRWMRWGVAQVCLARVMEVSWEVTARVTNVVLLKGLSPGFTFYFLKLFFFF